MTWNDCVSMALLYLLLLGSTVDTTPVEVVNEQVKPPVYYLSALFDGEPPVNTPPASRGPARSAGQASVSNNLQEPCYPYQPMTLYNTGELQFPANGGNYENNLYCVWQFELRENLLLKFKFERMDLQYHERCRTDILGIFNKDDQLVTAFCGSQLPDDVTLPSNKATLIFYSDLSVTSSGFTVQYTTDDIMEPPQNTVSGACGPSRPLHVDASSYGSWVHPVDFFAQYEANSDCEWLLTVPQGKGIQLYISMAIEDSTNCQKDYLKVYEGASVLQTFCGWKADSVVSNGNQLRLHFHSDATGTAFGFSLTYWEVDIQTAPSTPISTMPTTAVTTDTTPDHSTTDAPTSDTAACGPNRPLRIDATEDGTQYHPEDSSALYEANSDCEWEIFVYPGQTIRLEISTSIEQSTGCTKDYLKVVEGGTVLETMCGGVSKIVVSNGHRMKLQFHSDASGTGYGFYFIYGSVEGPATSATSTMITETGATTFPPTTTTETITTSITTTAATTTTPFSASPCGQRPQLGNQLLKYSPNIVEGDETIPYSWPWQVALHHYNIHQCGGSILHNNWVLTAAHCVDNIIDTGIVSVVASEHNQNVADVEEEHRQIDRIILHPLYNDDPLDNDIALLYFADPLIFNTRIQPVCLDENIPSTGQRCVITGWGDTNSSSEAWWRLREAEVIIIDQALCDFWYKGRVTQNQVCAGFWSGGIDSCKGDSGGPLVWQKPDGAWTLIGVTSWGLGCALARRPGVYTRVYNYISWIEQMTGLDL